MTATLVDTLVETLRANSCTVSEPMSVADARAAIVQRLAGRALVACNDDVALPGLTSSLAAIGIEVLDPRDPQWPARITSADAGITGSLLAVAEPAAIALAAAPGSPRGTSLVPPEHICVVRLDDLVPTLADAMQTIAAGELPSALTWIGGPSRTADLEMITTLGVHGPRAVDVVLVAGPVSADG